MSTTDFDKTHKLMNHSELRKFIESIDPDTLGFDENTNEDNSDYEFPVGESNVSGLSIGNNLQIIDNLTSVNYTNKYNPKKYLVVHYTAGKVDNGTAAKSNSEYFKSTYRGASAHYFVDCGPVVYRCVSDDLVAWHCGGASKYYHPECRNSNSIGVEICSYFDNSYKFKDVTYNNALTLCRWIVKKYNIPKDRVVMHYHVTHKICAAPFMSNSKPTSAWDNFKNAIFSDNKTINENITQLDSLGKVINVTNTLNARKGPGTNYDIVGSYKNGDKVHVISKINDWYKLDNNYYVNSSYIKLYNWADEYRDDLYLKGIITDKLFWSKYNEPITKGIAIRLTANMFEITNIGDWVDTSLEILMKHNVITDKTQWMKDALNEPISKALFLALICNVTGGIDDEYKNITVSHWGEKCLKTLVKRGIISNPETWSDLDSQVQKNICLAVISKSLDKIK